LQFLPFPPLLSSFNAAEIGNSSQERRMKNRNYNIDKVKKRSREENFTGTLFFSKTKD